MKIYNNLIELIGNTPLLRLGKYEKVHNVKANLIGKIEYFNPAGSVKDRIAYAMIDAGEKAGLINKDTVIIEPTSGNTGIGLAFVAAAKGYRIILTMPESMSIERRKLLKAYGAELILTPASEGMKGAIKRAEELGAEIPNSYVPQQFNNEANPLIHEETTAMEILRDMDEKVDIFIAGVGTGGTISGVGKALKENNPDVKIIAVEPEGSPVLSGGKPGPHKIQGIGAGFIPSVLDSDVIDEVIKVSNEEAFSTTAEIAKLEGLLVGISSGAAIYAAEKLGIREENKGKNIIIMLPDTGMRYLSTPVFD
ncbi:Cysteine synthase [Clostridium liquoris]|uniref:Cysteine synthase n=1 Tax=Clostridium liquoris TaxID=1289519 RepID=A0A2T0B554_9CLOT|nr:cysteine synthase A [Clostridium liquoris]PRR78927.1 Cysteine synthase [Clostridium liquoris]